MKRKSISIDEKLSSVLNFLCERENFNPKTIEPNDSMNILSQNVKEMREFKSTIDYLKDYAKLQSISKSLSNQEGIMQDIENAQVDFIQMIEDKKAEIKRMPRVSKKSIKVNMFDFQDEYKELEEAKYQKACEQRTNKIESLKEDIKIYQGKVKKLEKLKKSMGKPDKLMEILFPEEYTNLKENYARLINICVASMTDGFSRNDLIGDDKVFKFDGQKYSVNYKNARTFISVIKSKKEILLADSYIKLKNDRISKERLYEESLKKKEEYKRTSKVIDTNEFAWVTNNMNTIIEMYNDLLDKEAKAENGTIFSRARNKIRNVLKLPEINRTPKNVKKLRLGLSSKIKEFTSKINDNEELKNAFNAYQVTSRVAKMPSFSDVNQLEWVATELKRDGIKRVILPTKITNIQTQKTNIEQAYDIEKYNSEELIEEINMEKVKEEEMYSKFTKKTKKILETQKEEDILDYAKNYYGVGKNKEDARFIYNDNITPSSAAIILESILGRKNIPWENIVDNYASILGRHELENEGINMQKVVVDKIDSLKEKLVSMTKTKKETSREGDLHNGRELD